MHLALVISSMRSGGAERVMSNLANYWVEKGHQVSLILFTPKDEKPFYVLDQRVKVISLDCLRDTTSFLMKVKNNARCIFKLHKTLKDLKPERIVSFLETVNFASLVANIPLKIPHIISERTNPAYHNIGHLYKWARLKLYPLCTKLVVQTQGVYDYFSEKFHSFMEIIPNPIQQPKTIKIDHKDVIETIVTVGRLGVEKNHTTLIKAFKKYLDHNPKANLIIYGEGSDRPILQKLIDNLGLRDKVCLFGKTKNVLSVLKNADLFIFPSLYEGFPNALCEAMSIGLPVIASNVTGNRDVVQDHHNGLLFEVKDDLTLCEKMIELEDKNLRIQLSNNAREIANNYARSKIFKMWDDLIQRTNR